MPSMTFTVSTEAAQKIALAVGNKIRPIPFPGTPWEPPEPATMEQVRNFVAEFIKSAVREYDLEVQRRSQTPIVDIDVATE